VEVASWGRCAKVSKKKKKTLVPFVTFTSVDLRGPSATEPSGLTSAPLSLPPSCPPLIKGSAVCSRTSWTRAADDDPVPNADQLLPPTKQRRPPATATIRQRLSRRSLSSVSPTLLLAHAHPRPPLHHTHTHTHTHPPSLPTCRPANLPTCH
jgi:hypothetical protein